MKVADWLPSCYHLSWNWRTLTFDTPFELKYEAQNRTIPLSTVRLFFFFCLFVYTSIFFLAALLFCMFL